MLSTLRSSLCAFAFLGVIAPLAALAGCSGETDTAAAPLPDPASCSGAWTTILPLQTDTPRGPTSLTWHDGVLYGAGTIGAKDVLFALPDGGGTPRILAEDWAQSMWVDGSSLVYVRGDKMLSVPLAGGTPTVLIDGRLLDVTVNEYVVAQAFDGDALYMLRQSYANNGGMVSTLHRAHTGGISELLATLPLPAGNSWAEGIAIFGDDVVVAVDDGVAFAVPKNGGAARALQGTAGVSFLGFDDAGPLWRLPTGPDSFAISRTNVSPGNVEARWSQVPSSFAGQHVWGVDSGWLAFGLESFAGSVRASAWLVPGAGGGGSRRLACTPDALQTFATAAASAPDAIFVAVDRYFEPGHSPGGWEIERFAR